MSVSNFLALPVLLIGMDSAGAATAQTLFPCSGTAANYVSFRSIAGLPVALNASAKTVIVALFRGDTPFEKINIAPCGSANWTSKLQGSWCIANFYDEDRAYSPGTCPPWK